MRVLLDTNVVSELERPGGEPRVRRFIEDTPAPDLALSAITIGELERGVALLADGARKARLALWLSNLRSAFARRTLPIDDDIATLWGRTAADLRRRGLTVSTEDGLIAATAREHGMIVASRNVRDLVVLGVQVLDPWTGETHEPIS